MRRTLLTILLTAFGAVVATGTVSAYTYVGYRWGGSWPTVTMDYSGVLVNSWRSAIDTAKNDWNNAGAKFTFATGTSNNKVTVTYDTGSNLLAKTTVSRQWIYFGNVSKVTMSINSAWNFNPPTSSGIDLKTVMRHELGHWLVLNHAPAPSVMQATLPAATVRNLVADDKNGIKAIYGSR